MAATPYLEKEWRVTCYQTLQDTYKTLRAMMVRFGMSRHPWKGALQLVSQSIFAEASVNREIYVAAAESLSHVKVRRVPDNPEVRIALHWALYDVLRALRDCSAIALNTAASRVNEVKNLQPAHKLDNVFDVGPIKYTRHHE